MTLEEALAACANDPRASVIVTDRTGRVVAHWSFLLLKQIADAHLKTSLEYNYAVTIEGPAVVKPQEDARSTNTRMVTVDDLQHPNPQHAHRASRRQNDN